MWNTFSQFYGDIDDNVLIHRVMCEYLIYSKIFDENTHKITKDKIKFLHNQKDILSRFL